MKNVKKLNHFVWQHYLKPWTDSNGQIICKRGDKVFSTGTQKIACENYFYKLEMLSPDDLHFTKKVIFNDKNEEILKIDAQWLSMFSWIDKLIKIKGTIHNGDILNEINKTIIEFNENIHTSIEDIGAQYLEFLYNEDISFYNTEQGNAGFNIFLCEQYFRTKHMKETMIKMHMPMKNVNFKNCWNISAHILAINLAATLSVQRNYFICCLLKNDADISFYTSDQPVINISADNKNQRQLTINEFEFYYPITPKLVLLIGIKKNLLSNQTIIDLPEINVRNYNAKMTSQSGDTIFSNNRKGLI